MQCKDRLEEARESYTTVPYENSKCYIPYIQQPFGILSARIILICGIQNSTAQSRTS